MELTNVSSETVGYCVTSKNKYSIKPDKGRLPPGITTTVVMTVIAVPSPPYKDKVSIWTVFLKDQQPLVSALNGSRVAEVYKMNVNLPPCVEKSSLEVGSGSGAPPRPLQLSAAGEGLADKILAGNIKYEVSSFIHLHDSHLFFVLKLTSTIRPLSIPTSTDSTMDQDSSSTMDQDSSAARDCPRQVSLHQVLCNVLTPHLNPRLPPPLSSIIPTGST